MELMQPMGEGSLVTYVILIICITIQSIYVKFHHTYELSFIQMSKTC